MKFLFAALLLLMVVGAILWGPMASRVEQAPYTVESAEGSLEIRRYSPLLVAQVEVEGERSAALNSGFRVLADYIFGNNQSGEKVPMTAPVIQFPMAGAGAGRAEKESSSWKVRFVMPAGYTLETLPKPNSNRVILEVLPALRLAALRFSGTSSRPNLEQHRQSLLSTLEARHWKPQGPVAYAFYNPPWTLPFLRRNEVWVELAESALPAS